MKRIVIISLLVIALLVCSQGVVMANSVKVTVSGYATLGLPLNPPPPVWMDNGGNQHFDGVRRAGDFSVTDGDTFEFNGYRVVEIFGVLRDGVGHMRGPVTVYTSDAMDEVAWLGQMHVYKDVLASGEMILYGVGDYKGMQLKLDVEETSTAYFELEGRLLSAHGE